MMKNRYLSVLLIPAALIAVGCGSSFEAAKVQGKKGSLTKPGNIQSKKKDGEAGVITIGSAEQMASVVRGVKLSKDQTSNLNVQILVKTDDAQALELFAQAQLADLADGEEARMLMIDASKMSAVNVLDGQAVDLTQVQLGIALTVRYNKTKDVFNVIVDSTEELSAKKGFIVNANYTFKENADSKAIELLESNLGELVVNYDLASVQVKEELNAKRQETEVLNQIDAQQGEQQQDEQPAADAGADAAPAADADAGTPATAEATAAADETDAPAAGDETEKSDAELDAVVD